jgi:hypothetical protein
MDDAEDLEGGGPRSSHSRQQHTSYDPDLVNPSLCNVGFVLSLQGQALVEHTATPRIEYSITLSGVSTVRSSAQVLTGNAPKLGTNFVPLASGHPFNRLGAVWSGNASPNSHYYPTS